MNPSDASKPQARSEPPAEEQSAHDDSTELLIRVPLRDQEAPDDGSARPAEEAQKPQAAEPAPEGAAAAGRKQGSSSDQARPMFAAVDGAAPREPAPEGVDRARSGPPPEPDAALRVRFARLHLRTGSLMTARVQYEALAATGDLDLPGLLDLAEVRWRTADLAGAGAAAGEYLSKNGDQALGFLIAAEAAARGGRQVEARRSAEIAAERLAKDLDAIFGGLPRRLNWAGITPGPPSAPPVAIRIETPPKPEPKAAAPEGAPTMVSPEALWAQIVEVAQAADQAGPIAEEKATKPGPKPGAQPKPGAELKATTKPAAPAAPGSKPATRSAEAEPTAEAPEPAEPTAEAPEPAEPAEAAPAPAAEAPESAAEPAAEAPEPAPAAREAPAAEPVPAPAAKAEAHPWDESVAAGTAALEAADPLLAALHYAVALRMSPLAAPAVLEAIGDRRDLALELVRVDALRVATAAEAAVADAAAPEAPGGIPLAPEAPAPEPAKPEEPVRKAAPEPPPIRWE